jgi:deoxycytidylate deaminase
MELELQRRCAESTFRSRHAAVIYRGKRVLVYGVNRNKTHPYCSYYGKNPEAIYLHAELDAIVKVLNSEGAKTLKGATIAVCRTTRDGRYADSRPCEGCQRAIEAFGLKVEYTTKEGWTE